MQGDMCSLELRGHDRAQLGRDPVQLFAMLPYSCLAEELVATLGIRSRLAQGVAAQTWGAPYSQHPVVMANPGEAVVPCALYLDSVAYQKRDSVLGLWLQSLVTTRRHLFLCFRKCDRCRCGCRSWCNNFELFSFTAWAIEAMARGVCPLERHDGTPWAVGSTGKATAGQPMGSRAVVAMFKGDWG